MNSNFRLSFLSHAFAGALLLSLAACSGTAGYLGADANAATTVGSATPAVPTLTGSPMLDQAIRTGGDFEMVDFIREQVANVPPASRPGTATRAVGERQASK